MSNPLISVVLPVFNGEKFLAESIKSVIDQTFSDFEFLIINDGSTDSSLKIIKSFMIKDSRISVISRGNKGLIASLNEGIALSRGKYIARMDADDISLPKRFEMQLKEIKNKSLDICGCHFIVVNDDGKYYDTRMVSTTSDLTSITLLGTVPFAHGSVMFSKGFYNENKLSYGNTPYIKAEDYALWVDFFELGAKFGNVDMFLFKYRDVADSLSKNKCNSQDAKEISKKYLKKNKHIITKNIYNIKIYDFNSYELEQISYAIWLNFFSVGILNSLKKIRTIPIKPNLIGFLRAVKYLISF